MTILTVTALPVYITCMHSGCNASFMLLKHLHGTTYCKAKSIELHILEVHSEHLLSLLSCNLSTTMCTGVLKAVVLPWYHLHGGSNV